ncbi:hypothetical protein [Marinagarivorans algicola]|uniref:hypothetical protein n=1 Tax=Marinagarivorans algicola TaxID=1513270 RepID=UPI0006B91446|nr:hypothetical protein [Marinagarivorans algicola]
MNYKITISAAIALITLCYLFFSNTMVSDDIPEMASINRDETFGSHSNPQPKAHDFGNKSETTSPSKSNLKEETPEMHKRYLSVSSNPDFPQLTDRLDRMRLQRPNQVFDAESVLKVLEQPSAWTETDDVPNNMQLNDEDKNDGREFIHFNPLKIEALMPGDTLIIPVAQLQEEFVMIVDSIRYDETSLTWEGHIETNGSERYDVLITQSEKLTIAGINTSTGHYVLQAHDGVGWIASSQTLFKQEFSETDAVLPSEEVH